MREMKLPGVMNNAAVRTFSHFYDDGNCFEEIALRHGEIIIYFEVQCSMFNLIVKQSRRQLCQNI